jgi:hypothetical protein
VLSHDSLSITCIGREDDDAIADGERELVRVDEESAIDDSEPRLENKSKRLGMLPSNDLGLSLPVGPLPKGGRSSGGHPTIFLRRAFSTSSSETLCSRAYLQR